MHNQKFFYGLPAQLVRFRTEALATLAPFHPILSTGIRQCGDGEKRKKGRIISTSSLDARYTPALALYSGRCKVNARMIRISFQYQSWLRGVHMYTHIAQELSIPPAAKMGATT
jgi:hypothetical protein